MYALVKHTGKYIIMQKQLIINRNKRMSSIMRSRARNKISVIAYNNDAKLLETIQKNLNDNIPRVLIYRIEDSNNNLSVTVPQIIISNDEHLKEMSDISKINIKHMCLTNTCIRPNEKQFDNKKSQSLKNHFIMEQNSPYNIRNIGYNRYFGEFSTGELHDHKKKAESTSLNNHQINPKNTISTDYGKNINDSFDSQSPLINDAFLHTNDDNISFDIVAEQTHSLDSKDNDESSTIPQINNITDNITFQSKKCRILSNIALDGVSFNIIKNKTSFKICQRKKDNDDDLLSSNNCSFLQCDDNNFEINSESLKKISFLEDVSNKSGIVDNTSIEDISNSSKIDPTYKLSELDTTENSYTDNNAILSRNISTDKEKSYNISSDNLNVSHIVESSNVQPGSCNDAGLFVASSLGRSGAGKKNFCLYCKTFQSKIHRHLERRHKDEEDVQKFLDLPKKSIERRRIIDTIRRNGNFLFNTNTDFNDGELIVCRRPCQKVSRNAKDFQACIICKGFFSKATIRHHYRHCAGHSTKKNRSVMVLGRTITGRIHKAANPILTKIVFPVLREDHITRLIRYDELLIKYANKLCSKYKLQHQHDMIRSRLRLLGRFLSALKIINPNIDDFASLYSPKYYDDIIEAVNKVAGFDNQTNLYKTPSNATNLGTLLKQVGQTLITECIKKCDNSKKEMVEDLLKLLVEDYAASVARTALETQSKQKREKKIILPTTEDITKLYNYLKKLRQTCYEKLKKKFSYDIWLTLAKATLTAVLVFNRRRAGETERILVEEFNNRQAINEKTNNELFKSLSDSNKMIAKKYVRFITRGKKNRDVPVLLDSDLIHCILLLMEYRRYAKIHPRNPYLFALPGKNVNRFKFLRACKLLREFSHKCNAKLPTSLRGTKLRKHIATKCILLNLQGDEIEDLANYMGHAQNIHKEYYRQPIISRDILRMSQLLEKVQEDNVNEDDESDTDKDEENENSDEENISCNAKSDFNPNDLHRIESEVSYATDSAESSYNSTTTVKRKRSTSPYGKTKRRRWSNEEQEIVIKLFGKYINSQHLPSTKKILAAIKTHKGLQNRTAPQIRSWLHNQRKLNHVVCEDS